MAFPGSHGRQTADKGVHTPVSWTFADAATRIAFTPTAGVPILSSELTSDDVCKFAFQVDTSEIYMLTAIGPETWALVSTAIVSGDVIGPASATDEAVVRFNTTTGKLIQNSVVTITDTGAIAGAGTYNGNTVDDAGDPRTPTAHASTHSDGDSDEILVENLATASVNTSERLAPNGSGGVEFVAGGGGSFDIRDVTLFDHFVTANLDQDEIGSYGWRRITGGTGASISTVPEAGHPGIIQLDGGTVAAGRASLYLGENTTFTNWIFTGSQGQIDCEWLIKFTGGIGANDIERFTCGFGTDFDSGASVEHVNGIYIEFDPTAVGTLRLRTASASLRSVSNGTTTILVNTWYRVAIRVTYPAGVPTAQLLVNGVSEGSALTTNIPTAGVGVGARMEHGVSGIAPFVLLDYIHITQISDKED